MKIIVAKIMQEMVQLLHIKENMKEESVSIKSITKLTHYMDGLRIKC